MIERLAPAREIHIETAGTDLRLNVEGRTWINSDGRRNMPSGEVFTGPHEHSANGTIRFDVPSSGRGVDVAGVELTFKDGEVVAAHAHVGDQHLQAALGDRRRARASSASSGSAPTPASIAPPARRCSMRRWPAPCTWRSGARTPRPAAPTSRRCTGT